MLKNLPIMPVTMEFRIWYKRNSDFHFYACRLKHLYILNTIYAHLYQL